MKYIPLTQGKFAIVDDEDYEWLNQWKWCVSKQKNGDYYAVRRTRKEEGPNSKWILMHRQILKAQLGEQIDHRNHCGFDNRRNNLRFCTNSQNQHNRVPQIGTSKYKGVCWQKVAKKWLSQIKHNNNRIYLGCFENEKDAARAYDAKSRELYGEFAGTNF